MSELRRPSATTLSLIWFASSIVATTMSTPSVAIAASLAITVLLPEPQDGDRKYRPGLSGWLAEVVKKCILTTPVAGSLWISIVAISVFQIHLGNPGQSLSGYTPVHIHSRPRHHPPEIQHQCSHGAFPLCTPSLP